VTLQEKLIITPEALLGVCMAGAVLLRQRNVHMSALHHIVGLILFHGNISKLVCSVIQNIISVFDCLKICLGTLAAEPLTVVCVPGFNIGHC